MIIRRERIKKKQIQKVKMAMIGKDGKGPMQKWKDRTKESVDEIEKSNERLKGGTTLEYLGEYHNDSV